MDMGIPVGMGIGTVMNPHGPVGILWRLSNGCEIKRKRVKHAIHVIVSRCLNFAKYSPVYLFCWHFFFIITRPT